MRVMLLEMLKACRLSFVETNLWAEARIRVKNAHRSRSS